MTALRLTARRLGKVWGRRDLLPPFGDVPEDQEPVGEIWFEHPDGGDLDLLVKYLFTSERLSIQVHPDDAAARSAGEKSGKDEAWLILEAQPGATIGLGLREPVSPEALRAAALDGSIEGLIDWRPVHAGEIIYSPAGTIHAIGPGLKIVEVQQNVDLTYRLYDYGRPRELHLEQAIAAAAAEPYAPPTTKAFALDRWGGGASGTVETDHPVWLIPLAGSGLIDGEVMRPGTVWVVRDRADLVLEEGADLLVAHCGDGHRVVLS